MKVSRVLAAVGSVVVCALVVGCHSMPARRPSGIVQEKSGAGLGPGDIMPDARFVDSKGRSHLLSAVREDAAIVVVFAGPCNCPNPAVVAATEGLMDRVSVIVVSSDPKGCPRHTECALAYSDATRRIIAVCDARGELRRLFGVAGEAIAFVVDHNGRVVEKGGLDALPRLRRTAEQVARDEAAEREALYGGG